MGKRTIGAVVLLLALAAAVPLALPAQAPPDEAAVSRVEHAYRALSWSCIDFCGDYLLRADTPSDVAEVNVVVTATVTYRLPSGVRAWATLGWAEDGPEHVFPEPTTRLRPGSYLLRSSGGRWQTTTLTWFTRGLPAGGTAYRFHLRFAKDAKYSYPPPRAGSQKAVMVAELWSAGGS
jgi:hypothetical protein